MPKLVNLGSLCIDHVYRVPNIADGGETVASLGHDTYPGGKGLNQSLAAARAGALVARRALADGGRAPRAEYRSLGEGGLPPSLAERSRVTGRLLPSCASSRP